MSRSGSVFLDDRYRIACNRTGQDRASVAVVFCCLAFDSMCPISFFWRSSVVFSWFQCCLLRLVAKIIVDFRFRMGTVTTMVSAALVSLFVTLSAWEDGLFKYHPSLMASGVSVNTSWTVMSMISSVLGLYVSCNLHLLDRWCSSVAIHASTKTDSNSFALTSGCHCLCCRRFYIDLLEQRPEK